MRHTVRTESRILEGEATRAFGHHHVDIVVVARDSLPAATKLVSTVVPAAKAVKDDDLVPKAAFRFDGEYVRYG
ncbi:hypothetical protein D3C72_1056660 [compost metagenome]